MALLQLLGQPGLTDAGVPDALCSMFHHWQDTIATSQSKQSKTQTESPYKLTNDPDDIINNDLDLALLTALTSNVLTWPARLQTPLAVVLSHVATLSPAHAARAHFLLRLLQLRASKRRDVPFTYVTDSDDT